MDRDQVNRAEMPELPFLPFARPSITDEERRAVLEVLDSQWLTTGPRVQASASEGRRRLMPDQLDHRERVVERHASVER